VRLRTQCKGSARVRRRCRQPARRQNGRVVHGGGERRLSSRKGGCSETPVGDQNRGMAEAGARIQADTMTGWRRWPSLIASRGYRKPRLPLNRKGRVEYQPGAAAIRAREAADTRRKGTKPAARRRRLEATHAREAWDIASLHEEEDRRCEDVVSRKDQNIVLRMIGNKRLSPKADHLHRPRLLARMK
jgi:hypothetical protein